MRYANQSALKFLKNSKEELIGQKCYSAVYKRNYICPYCPLQKYETSFEKLENLNQIPEKGLNTQILYSQKFGNQNLNLQFFPIHSNEELFIEQIQDITKYREKEEENLRMRNLASLGVMVSGVAHELNNPLTGISLTLQSLQNRIEDLENLDIQERLELQSKYELMQSDLQKASQIVSEILSFARPEKRKMISSDIFDTILKAKETVERLNPSLCRKVRWEFIKEKDYVFYFDPMKMERVFINLFKNSLKAIDFKEGVISIEMKAKGNYCQISIEDSGGGIPDEIINKVFDPFFTSKKDNSGTGLGLSVCHSIIKEHKGSISVMSYDKKTKFKIRLPMEMNP